MPGLSRHRYAWVENFIRLEHRHHPFAAALLPSYEVLQRTDHANIRILTDRVNGHHVPRPGSTYEAALRLMGATHEQIVNLPCVEHSRRPQSNATNARSRGTRGPRTPRTAPGQVPSSQVPAPNYRRQHATRSHAAFLAEGL
jgi:hypothetical protein